MLVNFISHNKKESVNLTRTTVQVGRVSPVFDQLEQDMIKKSIPSKRLSSKQVTMDRSSPPLSVATAASSNAGSDDLSESQQATDRLPMILEKGEST